MVKTPKNSKKKKQSFSGSKTDKNKKKFSKTMYQNYISTVPISKNIKKNKTTSDTNDSYNKKIKNLFDLLLGYFHLDEKISKTSFENIKNIVKDESDELFIDFRYLLNPKKFYKCFCSLLKNLIKDNELEKLNNPKYRLRLYSIFSLLSSKDIKNYLFEGSISSYIKQDIILSIFQLEDNIDKYCPLLCCDDTLFLSIDKNKLIIDESIDTFKENYLFSNCVFNSIKLTLNEFIKVEDETLKKTINDILNKTNFYYCDIDESFSGISFLGYNVVIRSYFNNYKNDDSKVALRNVITHELIHLLLIELTDNNYFVHSFERSNNKIKESGNYFEKIFFGVDVQWYSKDLIDYLKNFKNLEKNINDFNQEIIKIYNNTCIADEKNIMALTDDDCIKNCILRNKANPIKINDYCQYGRCSRYYRKYNDH